MIPIYEQGQGHGIGHGFDSFMRRFEKICEEHLKSNRAKAFAFIFYDFEDSAIKKVLKDQGVFAQLDRLSGHDLSVFYLHAGSRRLVNAFNDIFLSAFDIHGKIELPAVIFFTLSRNEVCISEIVELERLDIMFAFHELYEVMKRHIALINNTKNVTLPDKFLKYLDITKRIVIEQFVKHILTKVAESDSIPVY